MTSSVQDGKKSWRRLTSPSLLDSLPYGKRVERRRPNRDEVQTWVIEQTKDPLTREMENGRWQARREDEVLEDG
jgi:hypothetical protein